MAYAKKKALNEQVIVITGAASGIGLATVEKAAQHNAKLVLCDFNGQALGLLEDRLNQEGRDVQTLVADVSEFESHQALARLALDHFGRVDSWINNAGAHIFGEVQDVSDQDARRLFDVDYWGVVYGSRVAIPLLEKSQGSLIIVGSVLSSQSVPLQSYYGAAKHALKSYTDSLRMRLQYFHSKISVSYILPSAIDTPIPHHSKNQTSHRVRLPMPLYHPDLVADAILECAERPRRDVIVGGVGKLGMFGEKYAPYWAHSITKLLLYKMQKARGPKRSQDALYKAFATKPQKRSDDDHYVLGSSLYTWLSLNPKKSAALLSGAAAAVTGIARVLNQESR